MPQRVPLGQLSNMERRIERRFSRNELQSSSLTMVQTRAHRIRDDISALTDSLAGGEQKRLVEDILANMLDFRAVVDAVDSGPDKSSTGRLARDVALQLMPRKTQVEVFIGTSRRQSSSPSCVFGEAQGELSIAILFPHDRFKEAPLRGLVAHEVSHLEGAVCDLLGSLREETRKRGEALADAFGLALLGPGFAWAVSSYLTGRRGRGEPLPLLPPNHPPWSVRLGVLRACTAGIWDTMQLRTWIYTRLEDGFVSLGHTGTIGHPTWQECVEEVNQSLARLRSVKIREGDVRPVLRRVRGKRHLRPILSFLAECPR